MRKKQLNEALTKVDYMNNNFDWTLERHLAANVNEGFLVCMTDEVESIERKLIDCEAALRIAIKVLDEDMASQQFGMTKFAFQNVMKSKDPMLQFIELTYTL